MQLLVWIYVGLVVVLLFGASIFVHEFGHFWVARRCGLKVSGFSIGFGPKIFGWTRDGVEYAWRWIPAGGFVALPQMVTSPTLEGKTEDPENLPPISPVSKILVALAGPVMNGLFAFAIACLIYFIGLPKLVNPAIVGELDPVSAEAKMGIQAGDRIVSVGDKPVSSWEEAQKFVMVAPTNQFPVVFDRKGERRTLLLTAVVNPDLGVKILNLDPLEHPSVGRVVAGGAAEAAGLKAGDEVVSFAGVPVGGMQQLIDLIRARPGKACVVAVLRGGKPVSLTATPRAEAAGGGGRLAMELNPSGTSVYEVQRPGPLPWDLMGEISGETFGVLRALFHSKQTGVKVSDLSGPPGILMALAAEVRADLRLALRFMVLLNISLGVLNLLPVPVLDGGHIVLALLEKVRGRGLNPRVQEYIFTSFAAALLCFILYASFNDVVRRLPLFRMMFDQRVRIESAAPATNPVPAAPAR